MTSRDARTIDLCLQMRASQEEQAVLLDRDPHAPDAGPNHPQYEALLAEYAALANKLTKAPPPTSYRDVEDLLAKRGRRSAAGNPFDLAPI
jgi:hypothetical protein